MTQKVWAGKCTSCRKWTIVRLSKTTDQHFDQTVVGKISRPFCIHCQEPNEFRDEDLIELEQDSVGA